MDYDAEEAITILKENGIEVKHNLKKISEHNNITSTKMYDTMFFELL